MQRGLQPLARDFFTRPTVQVARELLGMWVVSQSNGNTTAVRIVETEAYGGTDDQASHARAGLTRRTEPMFGAPGHAYVYLVYGIHDCLNVVARPDGAAGNGAAGAVLIRAGEPTIGEDVMRIRRARPADATPRLAAGPARLCQALAVDRTLDRLDLTKGERLWLAQPSDPGQTVAPDDVASGLRVGVAYAGEWAQRPWRFWVRGHPSVSRA
ncbi:DNA-3-methyladenine glycosylase [soil metagenome]